MPTFPCHRNDRNRLGLRHGISVMIACLLMTFTSISVQAEFKVRSVFSDLLPVTSWQPAGVPYNFTPSNLYEYINGAADFFIGYGFIELTGANFSAAAAPNDALTIDIYDMGDRLNAFGVFQARKGSQSASLNIGAASIGSEDYLAFIKGRFYVEMQASTDQNQGPQIKAMAAAVSDHLPGDNSLPPELAYFPETGKIAGSEKYISGGILGHAFLDRGIVCEYQIEGQKVFTFIAFFPSVEQAANAVAQHASFLQGNGKEMLPLEGFENRGFVSEEPFHHKIVVAQQGAKVAGVYDLKTPQQAKALLAELLRKIADPAGKPK